MKNYSAQYYYGLISTSPATGDASALTGVVTANVGDKIDLYNGEYGFGLQASRVVCYVHSGSGFAVRSMVTTGGARSAGTDAVTLLADGTITATGPISGTSLTASVNVTSPVFTQNGSTQQQLSTSGFNPNAMLPTGVGAHIMHDMLRWKTPTIIEVSAASNNTGWTTSGAPSSATVLTALMNRPNATALSLTTALPSLRLTGTGFLATYISHLLIGGRYQPGSMVRAIYETSPDGTTWTTKGDTVSSLDIHSKWTIVPVNDDGAKDYWRITLLGTSLAGTVLIGSIMALSTRPGDQGPGGSNIDVPYYWDGSRNMFAYGTLYAPNRLRAGFPAATATNTPLTTSGLEVELTSQSMIALGEGSAGDANPAITMYRTASGSRSGRALRYRLTASAGPAVWEWGGSNVAYGSETYTEGARLDASGNFSAAAQLAAYFGLTSQMRIVGSVASGAPTSGTFAVGDVSMSRSDGRLYACTVAGTPGTWVAQPLVQSGTVALGSLAAATEVTSTTFNFPTAYASAPVVTLTPSTGRVSVSVASVSTTGFTVYAYNHHPSSSWSGNVNYCAVGA